MNKCTLIHSSACSHDLDHHVQVGMTRTQDQAHEAPCVAHRCAVFLFISSHKLPAVFSCKSCITSAPLCLYGSHHTASLWLHVYISHLSISEFEVTAVNMKPRRAECTCVLLRLYSLPVSPVFYQLSACLRLYRVYSSSYLCPWGCISTLSSSLCYITACVPRSFPPWSYIILLLPPSVSYSDTYYLFLSIYVQPSSPSRPRQRCRICMWGVFSERRKEENSGERVGFDLD